MTKLMVALIAILISCGGKNSPKPVTYDLSALSIKHDNYLEISNTVTDSRRGWFDEKCDSLLFTSLVAHFIDVDINEAFYDGVWHRRPAFMGRCYPQHSGSSISRDMLLGVLWYGWKTRSIGLLTDLRDYGKANDWKFGEGDPARIYMSAQMMGTLYLIIQNIEKTDYVESSIPLALFQNDSGYQAHLGVLHALLRADIYGYAPDYYVDYFRYHAKRKPRNTLFQYAVSRYDTGDFSVPISQLMNPVFWPIDGVDTRLRCEPWAWQRDDWKSCHDQDKTHSLYDFLFISNQLLE